MTHGTPIRMPIVVNVNGGMPLPPGRYEWRASIEGFEAAAATESFHVHPAGQPA